MKKYLSFVAALTVAFASQAASVEWSSGDLQQLALDHTDITGITAYYYCIDSSTYTELSSQTSAAIYAQYKGQEASAAYTESLTRPFTYSSFEETDAKTYDVGGTPTAYIVAVYVAQSAFGGSYALASTAYATFESGEGVVYGDATGGNFAGDETHDGIASMARAANIAAGEDPWAPVPEPTTVALLALGLAAVGLKRKVA